MKRQAVRGDRLMLRGRGPALVHDILSHDTAIVTIISTGQLRSTVVQTNADDVEEYNWPEALEDLRTTILRPITEG